MPKSAENTRFIERIVSRLVDETVRTRSGRPESRDIFFADAFIMASVLLDGPIVQSMMAERIILSAVARFCKDDAIEFLEIFKSWKVKARLEAVIKLCPHLQVRNWALEYAMPIED